RGWRRCRQRGRHSRSTRRWGTRMRRASPPRWPGGSMHGSWPGWKRQGRAASPSKRWRDAWPAAWPGRAIATRTWPAHWRRRCRGRGRATACWRSVRSTPRPKRCSGWTLAIHEQAGSPRIIRRPRPSRGCDGNRTVEPQLKQRLIGAAVLVALAVIFLPMLVKGPAPDSGVSDVPLKVPEAPQGEYETRDLPLVVPEEAPEGGVTGMLPAPAGDAQSLPTVDTTAAPSANADQAAEGSGKMLPPTVAGGDYAVHFAAYDS